MADNKKLVGVRLEQSVLNQIDMRRTPLGLSRQEWIVNMVKWCLANTATIQGRP